MALNTPIFHVRGDSTTARVSQNGAAMLPFISSGGTLPVVTADAGTGVFGGFVIDKTGTAMRSLLYPAGANMSQVPAFTVLLRIKWSQASGAPTTNTCFFSINSGQTPDADSASLKSHLEVTIAATSGNIQVFFSNSLGQAIVNAVIGTKTNWVNGQVYDIWFTHDGSTISKMFIDQTLVSNMGMAFQDTAAPSRLNAMVINIGYGLNQGSGNYGGFSVNEFAIWNTDETANIIARSAWLASTAFNAQTNVDPLPANVRSGTGYMIAGVAKTGLAAIPAASDVRLGVATDATTGTVNVPTAANTKHGVSTDVAGVGTYTGQDLWQAVTASQLQLGVSVLQNGTLINGTDIGAAFNDAITASMLKVGLTVKNLNTLITGTYDGSDRWTALDPSVVVAGVSYQSNSLTPNKVGTREDVSNLIAGPTLTGPKLSAQLRGE